MTGRLLAAYGLPSVISPFRISAPVHQKVLRADGWLEYRSDSQPQTSSLAATAAHSTPATRPMAAGVPSTRTLRRSAPVVPRNAQRSARTDLPTGGIVFAAYRLPNADGTVLSSDKEELDRLYQDAELFVETLIDIHMMQRQKDLQADVRAAQAARTSARRCTQGEDSRTSMVTNPQPTQTPPARGLGNPTRRAPSWATFRVMMRSPGG